MPMSQTTNPEIVTLTVTKDAAHFILDCVADRPFKHVAPLLAELHAQVQVQANTQAHLEEVDSSQSASIEENDKATEATAAPQVETPASGPWPWRRHGQAVQQQKDGNAKDA